jgi:hypothetical protein
MYSAQICGVLVDHQFLNIFFASHSLSLAKIFTPSEEEFVMVPHTPTQGGILKRPQSAMFPLSLGASRPPPAVNLHIQTGSNSSMVGVVYLIT